MISFRNLNLKHKYNFSKGDKVLDEFYIPSLKNAVKYDRATGYFTSASLVAAAAGMAQFVKNNGKYRLIFGREVPSEKDFDAMVSSYGNIFEEEFSHIVENFELFVKQDPRAILGWMIKNNFLEVKICFRRPDTYTYHSKWANMYDSDDNIIHFNGSLNETYSAWVNKPENILVMKDWFDETQNDIVHDAVSDFEAEWNNSSPTVETVDLPKVLKDKLIFASDAKIISKDDFFEASQEFDKVISEIAKKNQKTVFMPKERDYQKEAVKKWENNDHKGIFAHATGLGKTYASLFSLLKLSEKLDNKYLCILVAPKTLHEQWKDNIEIDFAAADLDVEILSSGNWQSILEEGCQNIDLEQVDNKIFIVTYNKFANKKFIQIINESMAKKFLIVDEAHNVGSKSRNVGLVEDYQYRLALTATPTRHFDEFGTKLIVDYFGGVCSEYDLKWAIENDKLCPYYYYVHEATLNEEEQEKYHEITLKMMNNFEDKKKLSQQSDAFKMLAINRGRIIKKAENKKDIFMKLIEEDSSLVDDSFIFCPDDSFLTDICQFLQSKGVRYGQVTSKMNDDDRASVLAGVKNGKLDCVVGIDCLDEGVDIPASDKAFLLSSSSNPKQFIQRRGRVLRKADNKKYAKIYDFLCFPLINDKSSKEHKMEKSLIENQLSRLLEFSEISLNSEKNQLYINSIAKKWDIDLNEE